jgi:hypothetical protein
MTRFIVGFALVAALAVTLGGLGSSTASAQTSPTPTPSASPMSSMQP